MKKLVYLSLIGAMLLCPTLASCSNGGNAENIIEDVSNEDGSAYYEVFVGEYADSNGDGVGDLNGLSAKLPYLKKLGVSGIWLMPIMPSNSYHKYDVNDYYSIDSSYGTMEDFENLIAVAKENNIDVIIDLVLNHTSKSCSWFKQSEKDYRDNYTGDDSYKDWYVWKDKSATGYSFDTTAGAYYECNFDSGMPELNMDCQAVRDEIQNIAKFWLDKGCKGFRLDAAKYFYYENATKNVEFLTWLKDYCATVRQDVYMVGEAYISATGLLLEYAGSGVSLFNFPMSATASTGWAYTANRGKAYNLANAMTSYYAKLEAKDSVAEDAPFISNHDMDRSGGYLKDNYAKLAATNYLLAKGHPYIYYGEEIGLRGVRPSNSSTDADRRLAMIWSEENDTYRCNDPVGTTYNSSGKTQVTKGALDNIDDSTSLTYAYRKILSIRNKYNNFFQYGAYESLTPNDDENKMFVMKMTYNGETIIRVTNMGDEDASIDIGISNLSILDEINFTNSKPSLSGTKVSVGAFNSIILK